MAETCSASGPAISKKAALCIALACSQSFANPGRGKADIPRSKSIIVSACINLSEELGLPTKQPRKRWRVLLKAWRSPGFMLGGEFPTGLGDLTTGAGLGAGGRKAGDNVAGGRFKSALFSAGRQVKPLTEIIFSFN